ncbi:MAG: hypothetical protein ACI9D5_002449 [Candidatus Endobugula sp.]|jgi:hypothetical protein
MLLFNGWCTYGLNSPHRLSTLFNELKEIAPQLTLDECWNHLLQKIVDYFEKKSRGSDPPGMFLPAG